MINAPRPSCAPDLLISKSAVSTTPQGAGVTEHCMYAGQLFTEFRNLVDLAHIPTPYHIRLCLQHASPWDGHGRNLAAWIQSLAKLAGALVKIRNFAKMPEVQDQIAMVTRGLGAKYNITERANSQSTLMELSEAIHAFLENRVEQATWSMMRSRYEIQHHDGSADAKLQMIEKELENCSENRLQVLDVLQDISLHDND